ncbi:MAG: RNA methyltransferase substrate-binding domain-containing protein, partial [Faecalibacillus sp.]
MKQYIYGKNPIIAAIKDASVYQVYMLNGNKDHKIYELCKKKQIPLVFTDKKEFDKKVGNVVHQGVMA